jgi:hypothetical protein
MEGWLATLESQLSAAMPAAPKVGVPDVEVTWLWVEELCKSALTMADIEMSTDGAISYATAWCTQQALIAALVTGLYAPPPRYATLGGFACTKGPT